MHVAVEGLSRAKLICTSWRTLGHQHARSLDLVSHLGGIPGPETPNCTTAVVAASPLVSQSLAAFRSMLQGISQSLRLNALRGARMNMVRSRGGISVRGMQLLWLERAREGGEP